MFRAACIQLRSGEDIDLRIVGDNRPRLSRSAEREIAQAIDLVLQVAKPEEKNETFLQLMAH